MAFYRFCFHLYRVFCHQHRSAGVAHYNGGLPIEGPGAGRITGFTVRLGVYQHCGVYVFQDRETLYGQRHGDHGPG